MDFYVYLHKKKTTGEVFYVGKGCRDRAWTKTRRNEDWHVVVEECGYFVEIVQDNLQEWYSFELEGLLIDYYGKKSDGKGTLVNKKGGAFEKRFGINIRPLFGKGKSKTQKGWRLEEFPCKN